MRCSQRAPALLHVTRPSAPIGVCVRAGVWGRAQAEVRGEKPRRGLGQSPEEKLTLRLPGSFGTERYV